MQEKVQLGVQWLGHAVQPQRWQRHTPTDKQRMPGKIPKKTFIPHKEDKVCCGISRRFSNNCIVDQTTQWIFQFEELIYVIDLFYDLGHRFMSSYCFCWGCINIAETISIQNWTYKLLVKHWWRLVDSFCSTSCSTSEINILLVIFF